MQTTYTYGASTIIEAEDTITIKTPPTPRVKTIVLSTKAGKNSYTFPDMFLGKYKTLYHNYEDKNRIETQLSCYLFC